MEIDATEIQHADATESDHAHDGSADNKRCVAAIAVGEETQLFEADGPCRKECIADGDEAAELGFRQCNEGESEWKEGSCDNAECHRAYAGIDFDELRRGLSSCSGDYADVAQHAIHIRPIQAAITIGCQTNDPEFDNFDPECHVTECGSLVAGCTPLDDVVSSDDWGTSTDYVVSFLETNTDNCVDAAIDCACSKCPHLDITWPANADHAVCRAALSPAKFAQMFPTFGDDDDNYEDEEDAAMSVAASAMASVIVVVICTVLAF